MLAGLIMLMLQCGGAVGDALHVSADGSDENPGTKEEPWATFQRAVDAAKPGDTILVSPGVYAGCVIRRAGTAEAPIVLKAAGPGVHVDRPGPENRRRSCIEVGTHREPISHWVVDGFEVSGARRWGINVGRTEHVTVQHCRVHDCGLTGIFTAFSDHVTIQFNESYDNQEHGIYHSNSGDYPVIRGNRSHHNAGCGIHMNGDRNMGGDGLISHALVERNIIWENGRAGGSAINCDGVSDSVLRNNLCYDNHASGISLYAIDAAEGSSRNDVYHNTVVMGPEGRWVLNIPWWQRRPPPVGNRVANNIFYTSNPETGAILIWGEKALAGCDHNLVVGRFAADGVIPKDTRVAHLSLERGAALRPAEGGRTRLDLQGWQQLGWGAHSRAAMPETLFANAAEDDYRLRDGSPAIGAGKALPEVTEDLRGRPRDTGRADVGCYAAEDKQSARGALIALAVHAAGGAAAVSSPEVTITGSLLCNRACIPEKWDHSPTSGDHTLALFALAGTPEIEAALNSIMEECWPGDTLDCDQAVRLLAEFDRRLKYYLTPSPLVDSYHEKVEYPALSMSVTGTVRELDGKRWIDVSRIEPANLSYPAKMLAPDTPLAMPEEEPLLLHVSDTITLTCIKLPPGRYLRGSPFYEQPRWQDEFPHEVTLTKSFYLSEIPITQEMFETVVGTNPSKRTPRPYTEPRGPEFNERFRHATPDDGPDFAVENATWEEIQQFCRALSGRNGVTVRLPTDAEWEYAARVGTSSPCFTEKYLAQRSYLGDVEGRCEPVKRHQPNAWGLYDMVHSGWELVGDYKADNVRNDQVDPQGPPREGAADHGTGPLRRTKGGAYYGDTHLNLHGACDEAGSCEEGIMIFRVAVDAPAAR